MSWKDYLEGFDKGNLPVAVISEDHQLVSAIQEALIEYGSLDPPADRVFGPVSNWALKDFCTRNGLSLEKGFTAKVARSLIKPKKLLAQAHTTNHWMVDIVERMRASDQWISRHPKCWNIVYVEGLSIDGVRNDDRPNQFNDVRIVFSIGEQGEILFYVWEATTEPGSYWTITRKMNSKGAARIAFGQYKAWTMGIHRNDHEALVQTKPVRVHRDLNEDFSRIGEKQYEGVFGINQHWGYDFAGNDLKTSSAGCLVGRTTDGHREFLKLLKRDPRYATARTYTFLTSIVPPA